jgi:DNA polymerase-3 subunit chi
MTTVDFYFNAPDRFEVACRLAGKACAQKKKLLIYAPGADVARRIDSMLWTWQPLSFIPHCLANDPLAPQTPVLIASGADTPPECDVLLNLAEDCPPFFERFPRLLEIVGRGDEERSLGRGRFKYYMERGYAIGAHDLAAAGTRA